MRNQFFFVHQKTDFKKNNSTTNKHYTNYLKTKDESKLDSERQIEFVETLI